MFGIGSFIGTRLVDNTGGLNPIAAGELSRAQKNHKKTGLTNSH